MLAVSHISWPEIPHEEYFPPWRKRRHLHLVSVTVASSHPSTSPSRLTSFKPYHRSRPVKPPDCPCSDRLVSLYSSLCPAPADSVLMPTRRSVPPDGQYFPVYIHGQRRKQASRRPNCRPANARPAGSQRAGPPATAKNPAPLAHAVCFGIMGCKLAQWRTVPLGYNGTITPKYEAAMRNKNIRKTRRPA